MPLSVMFLGSGSARFFAQEMLKKLIFIIAASAWQILVWDIVIMPIFQHQISLFNLMKIIKGNHCNHAISPHLNQLAIVQAVYFTALKLMCHAKLCWDRFEGNCYFDFTFRFVHRSVSVPDITLWFVTRRLKSRQLTCTIQIQHSPQEIMEKKKWVYFGTK